MFEHERMRMSHIVGLISKFSRGGRRATFSPSNTLALFQNSQGVVEGQHFYPTTQNGARTANVFDCKSKMHILKSSKFKVHLTSKFFFLLKRIYLLFEIVLRKNFWIRLNPRFSVPRPNLENSTKTPPFCFATEFGENGSSGCYDVYPGSFNISRPLISFRMVQYTSEKWAEMPSRIAIDCCSKIPDLRKDILYNFLAIIGQ